MKQPISPQRLRVAESYAKHGGNISAIARELELSRSTVQHHVKKLGHKKPLAGGSVNGTPVAPARLPRPGQVKRYILTSAQNNTRLHEGVWTNLKALAEHYGAEILVGTFTYNRNAYGPLAVKKGTHNGYDRSLWYDERVKPYIRDERVELGNGLLWCGEMNIMPTASDPLEGLETYSGRKSGIFPHTKHAMTSIATMMDDGTKFNYSTGTVTQRNYLQKKAGLVAEHHHSYGGLIVEVNSNGNWWVRQLDADEKGRIYDLKLCADEGKVTDGHRVEAINWGDIHAACVDGTVTVLALGNDGMLAKLRPRYQFLHDVMEGVSINHHAANNPHEKFRAYLRGFSTLSAELGTTAGLLRAYNRPWCQSVVVDSNHDSQWLYRWLREHDYRRDPHNAVLFLELQLAVYKAMENHDNAFHITEVALRTQPKCPDAVRFLRTDESFTICDGRIECGMHGHLGPNGARGTAANLKKIGRRANIGHIHSAGIYDGLYVAGTSTNLDMGFNKGPSAWSHTHVVTYPNGKRTLITMFAGQWRA